MRTALAAGALVGLAACDPGYALRDDPPPLQSCRDGTGTTRFVVENFYRRALVDKQVRAAFEAYASPAFIEHTPDVADPTREGAIELLEGLIRQFPDARWEIVRVVADGDTSVVHARATLTPGAPPYAVADFFRVKDCRLAEHWDVVAGPVEGARNPLSRF